MIVMASSRSLPLPANRDTHGQPRHRGDEPPAVPFVTTTQAARELGVGVRSLQRWTAAGLIEPDFRTPGGHARWDVARLRGELLRIARELQDRDRW